MKTITLNLSDDQAARLLKLATTTMAGERATTPKTLEQQINAVIEKGLYAIEYNRKQYVAKKTGNAIWKMVQKDPSIMVKLGLATTVTAGTKQDESDEDSE